MILIKASPREPICLLCCLYMRLSLASHRSLPDSYGARLVYVAPRSCSAIEIRIAHWGAGTRRGIHICWMQVKLSAVFLGRQHCAPLPILLMAANGLMFKGPPSIPELVGSP